MTDLRFDSWPQLYFAYGSNLHFQQMATRCPNSRYAGRAILLEHQWQINERGYANVVARSGFVVHGLVYMLGVGDEARLDRSEGVSKGSYSKSYREVVLYSPPESPSWSTRWVTDHGGPGNVLQNGAVTQKARPRFEPNVLVYLSYNYVTEGKPLDEYVGRMNLGIEDATALGVPQEFIQRFLRPCIPRRTIPTALRRHKSHGGSTSQTRPRVVRSRSPRIVTAEPPPSSEYTLRRTPGERDLRYRGSWRAQSLERSFSYRPSSRIIDGRGRNVEYIVGYRN